MKKIKVLIITGYGINCEQETASAFKQAGAQVNIVHLNEVIQKKNYFKENQIIVIPGGFSYGDHIRSGKIFANKINFYLHEEFQKFIAKGYPVLGICNGFQILVKTGLFPDLARKNQVEVTLIENDSSLFINRWVPLKKNLNNKSFWLTGIERLTYPLMLPIRHGEGKFFTSPKTLKKISEKNLFALHYLEPCPNGSLKNIAALTNSQGNVFALMPHPEAFRSKELAPFSWKDKITSEYNKFPFLKKDDGLGMLFFYNAIRYLKKN